MQQIHVMFLNKILFVLLILKIFLIRKIFTNNKSLFQWYNSLYNIGDSSVSKLYRTY